MSVTDLQGNSGVGHLRLGLNEERALHEASADFYPVVEDMGHAEALRFLAAKASEVAVDTPELADRLRAMSSRQSFRTLVVDLATPSFEFLPKTPDHHLTPEENPILRPGVTRGLLLGMMGVTAVGYQKSQQAGNIINNVIPIRSQSEQRIKGVSANALDQLGLHTEDASYNLGGAITQNGTILPGHTNISPDWLTIQFLRNPNLVESFVSVPDLNELSADAYQQLLLPNYHNSTNPSQQEDGHTEVDLRQGVIYDDNFLRVNADGLKVAEGIDQPEKAQRALAELQRLFRKSIIYLPSSPGDIIITDNLRVVHGRAKPKVNQMPRWDGTDRWQQRVVAYDSLDNRQEFVTEDDLIMTDKFMGKVAVLAAA